MDILYERKKFMTTIAKAEHFMQKHQRAKQKSQKDDGTSQQAKF